MLAGLQGWHFLILLAVVLLLFGAAKLPALAKSMGQSARLFRGEMKAMKDEGDTAEGATAVAAPETTTKTGSTAESTGTGEAKP